MAFAEYDHYDALGLAQLVRRGEVSPLELVDEAIARIEVEIFPAPRTETGHLKARQVA